MDLPAIPEDINAPLPESPDPELTPYRLARLDPGASQRVYTTGWARRPVQPPQGVGGVQMPDLGDYAQQMLQHYPIEEAKQRITLATKFLAQRGYQADTQAGMTQPEAMSKWGYLLFGDQPGGAVEAMRMSQPPPNKLFDISGGLYRAGPTGPVQTLVSRPSPMHINQTTGEIVQTSPDGTFHVLREGSAQKLSETDKALLAADVSDLKDTEKELLLVTNKRKRTELQTKAADLRKKIATDYGAPTTPAPPSTAAPMTATPRTTGGVKIVKDSAGRLVNPAKSAIAPTGRSVMESIQSIAQMANVPAQKVNEVIQKGVQNALREIVPPEYLKQLGLEPTPVTGPEAGMATEQAQQ